MKNDYDFGPKSFLARYHDLNISSSILSDLARLNPNLTQDIIELAMVMAIHAEKKRAAQGITLNTTNLAGSPKGPTWDNIGTSWEGFKK